jgi:excisionase family DNA binding protein
MQMSDVGFEALDLLTAAEVAQRLRCSTRKVCRLADEGELVKVKMGTLARYTPESVAAYKARLVEQAGAAQAS